MNMKVRRIHIAEKGFPVCECSVKIFERVVFNWAPLIKPIVDDRKGATQDAEASAACRPAELATSLS